MRTEEPDYLDLLDKEYDWSRSVYGNVHEQPAEGRPPPKGKRVITMTYVDVNLYHDLLTGKAVTGVLHFINPSSIGSRRSRRPWKQPLMARSSRLRANLSNR